MTRGARGLSLIELVLALGVSGLVLAAVLGLLVSAVRGQRLGFAEAALVREGEHAALLLERDVRRAGVDLPRPKGGAVPSAGVEVGSGWLTLIVAQDRRVVWRHQGHRLEREVCVDGACDPPVVVARHLAELETTALDADAGRAAFVEARLVLVDTVLGAEVRAVLPVGAAVGGWR